jgi:hypothetical protein
MEQGTSLSPEHADRLVRACRLLLDLDVDRNREFLFHVRPSGLKSAFRLKARRCHPDRAWAAGEAERLAATERFIRLKEAYEDLSAFVAGRRRLTGPPPRRAQRRSGATGAASSPRGFFHGGVVPRRPLRFGEFLFYRGEISLESLIEAVAWQRRGRPRLGDLAARWGWISREDASRLQTNRRPGELFGQAMLREGVLTPAQLRLLVWRQRSLQQAIGEYFLGHPCLGPARLRTLLQEQALHNRTHRRP